MNALFMNLDNYQVNDGGNIWDDPQVKPTTFDE